MSSNVMICSRSSHKGSMPSKSEEAFARCLVMGIMMLAIAGIVECLIVLKVFTQI